MQNVSNIFKKCAAYILFLTGKDSISVNVEISFGTIRCTSILILECYVRKRNDSQALKYFPPPRPWQTKVHFMIFQLTSNVQNELSARRPAHVWSGVCRANQRRGAEADMRADWLI